MVKISGANLSLIGWALIVGVGQVESTYRMVVVGNHGEPSGTRNQTAETLKAYAVSKPISSIVSTGANFPGGLGDSSADGILSSHSQLFSGKENELRVPFYTILGSSDWASNVEGYIKYGNKAYETANLPDHKAAIYTMPNFWYHQTIRFSTASGLPILSSQSDSLAIGLYMLDSFIISSEFPFTEISEKAREDFQLFLEIAPRIYDYIVIVSDRKLRNMAGRSVFHGDPLEELLDAAAVDLYISGGDPKLESYPIMIPKSNSDSTRVLESLQLQCNSFSSRSAMPGLPGGRPAKVDGANFSTRKSGFCALSFTADGITVEFVDGESGITLHETKRARLSRPQRDSMSPYTHFARLPEIKYYPLPEFDPIFGKDIDFVTVCGTIGMIITAIFVLMGGLTAASKLV